MIFNINTKIVIFLLIILLLFPSFISANNLKTSFSDVNRKNWYYNTVMELNEKGIISGYGDNTFRPNENITFGEFLKLAINSTTGKDFKSSDGEHWAVGVYKEAIFRGVIDSTNFRPTREVFDSPITREEMTYISIGVNENIQKESALNTSNIKLNIDDMNDISEKNKISVKQAFQKGLINGKNGSFQPKSNASRAEASTIIIRLLNKSKRIQITD